MNLSYSSLFRHIVVVRPKLENHLNANLMQRSPTKTSPMQNHKNGMCNISCYVFMNLWILHLRRLYCHTICSYLDGYPLSWVYSTDTSQSMMSSYAWYIMALRSYSVLGTLLPVIVISMQNSLLASNTYSGMIKRWSTNIFIIIKRKMFKLKTHNLIYCIKIEKTDLLSETHSKQTNEY